jgi:DinB family protein
MDVHLEDTTALLARTPAVLSGLLCGTPQAWLDCREAPKTFSPLDVLGHLIYAEQVNWLPRIRIILEHGEARPFDVFDRVGFEDLIAGKSVEELLNVFTTRRNQSLQELAALKLQPNILARKGTHPALGQVTLGQLLATWVVHDLSHLAQIERVMARQYRDAVGPWRENLRILEVPGSDH